MKSKGGLGLKHSTIEDTLHKAANGVNVPGESINVLIEHFHDDIQKDDLCTELSMLQNVMQGIEFSIAALKGKTVFVSNAFPPSL